MTRERTRDCMMLTDVVSLLAHMDNADLERAIRQGQVGLVGRVFGLKPRELVRRVRVLRGIHWVLEENEDDA